MDINADVLFFGYKNMFLKFNWIPVIVANMLIIIILQYNTIGN